MNKSLIIIIMLIAILPLAAAIKPTPQTTVGSSNTLVIAYPKAQAYKIGEGFDLYFHVFNSTGHPQSNTTASCTLHIYNDSTNQHIVNATLAYYGNYDFEYEVSSTIFNKTGFYPYIVWCIAGSEGGFVSDEILINADGEGELSTTGSGMFVLGAIILLPLLFGFLIMKWASILGEEHNTIRLFLSLLAVMSYFISVWFATLSVIKMFLWEEMQEALTTNALIVGSVLLVIVSYFIIVMLKNIIEGINENKDKKFDY